MMEIFFIMDSLELFLWSQQAKFEKNKILELHSSVIEAVDVVLADSDSEKYVTHSCKWQKMSVSMKKDCQNSASFKKKGKN